MKLVYQAANSIEAHMILHQLEQAGLSGRIDGEFLQGGVGELQASGIIRVMVEESDYAAAKAIVTEWDAVQPAVIETRPTTTTHPLLAGFIGFILGLASLSLYYYSSVTYDGIDYNNDGTLDEK
ncbi:MAG: DUF2007 domain-containing protein [Porticoccaceae bacterium]|nr:DUF2007 domain-containing protein [Porticoccaceae bacterium]